MGVGLLTLSIAMAAPFASLAQVLVPPVGDDQVASCQVVQDFSANNDILDVEVFDDGSGPALYVAGAFTEIEGIEANYIARWNGLSWSALNGSGGNGTNGLVNTMFVHDDGSGPALFVGGSFTEAGGAAANYIARWTGVDWQPITSSLGNGVSDRVTALAEYDDGSGLALYVGGYFSHVGWLPVNLIARWDGSSWSALVDGGTGVGSYPPSAAVLSFAVWDDGSGPALYLGGRFCCTPPHSPYYIFRWDGGWESEIGLRSDVRALAVADLGEGGSLYAGGYFSRDSPGTELNGIGNWDGNQWQPLAGPVAPGLSNTTVLAIHGFDPGTGPLLFAGGGFGAAGGIATQRFAYWDGSRWWGVLWGDDSGLDFMVTSMTEFDDGSGNALYLGGEAFIGGGLTGGRLGKWACTLEPARWFADGFESGDTLEWTATESE